MQQNNLKNAILIIIFSFLVGLLFFPSEVAAIIGSDRGVTISAILYSLVVLVPVTYTLKKIFDAGPAVIVVTISFFIWWIWWKVFVNAAEKLPEPAWWNTGWVHYGVGFGLLLFLVFLATKRE